MFRSWRALLIGIGLCTLLTACGPSLDLDAPVTELNTTWPAEPVSIEIPAIAAKSTLIGLGRNPDRTMTVPPIDRPNQASWYTEWSRPGEPGNAIILGHVDGQVNGRGGQPGIFANLGQLDGGDKILIGRADGTVATFAVSRIQQIPKTRFPADQVFVAMGEPGLVLVTCQGDFRTDVRSYSDNLLVYAKAEAP